MKLTNERLIEFLVKFDNNVFSAYEFLAGELGIYHLFYGHKVSYSQKRRLTSALKRMEILAASNRKLIQSQQTNKIEFKSQSAKDAMACGVGGCQLF